MKNSPPAEGVDSVRIAGDPERETRILRERDGIAVDATTWGEIKAGAATLGITAEALEQMARGN